MEQSNKGNISLLFRNSVSLFFQTNTVEVSSVMIETKFFISSWNSSLTDVKDSEISTHEFDF